MHLLAAKVIALQTYGYAMREKKNVSWSFHDLYRKRRGQLTCLTKEEEPKGTDFEETATS